MKEAKRQFVVFGNFNTISLNNINLLDDIKNQFGLQINALPDIISPNQMGIQPVFFQSVPSVSIRPVLQSEDKKTSIFFGSSRLHVEQLEQDVETYDEFFSIALNALNAIYNTYQIKINRIAINGQLLCFDKQDMEKAYSKYFKKSDLYGESSNEWQFRINTNKKDEELDCEINQIISFSRNKLFDKVGVLTDALQSAYDYNTKYGLNKLFTIKDIEIFNKKAYEFRKSFIK